VARDDGKGRRQLNGNGGSVEDEGVDVTSNRNG